MLELSPPNSNSSLYHSEYHIIGTWKEASTDYIPTFTTDMLAGVQALLSLRMSNSHTAEALQKNRNKKFKNGFHSIKVI